MPNSCFANNNFPIGFSSCEGSIGIQADYNPYKAITYVCAYLFKAEECSNAMKEASQESHEKDNDSYTKAKSITKFYKTKKEVSVLKLSFKNCGLE